MLDEATTDICRSLNGKIFRVEDMDLGVNVSGLKQKERQYRNHDIGVLDALDLLISWGIPPFYAVPGGAAGGYGERGAV